MGVLIMILICAGSLFVQQAPMVKSKGVGWLGVKGLFRNGAEYIS